MATLVNIRGIGVALNHYADDHDGLFPSPELTTRYVPMVMANGAQEFSKSPFTWPASDDVKASVLADDLYPDYLTAANDPLLYKSGWKYDIYYAVSGDSRHFIIYAYGSDNKRDRTFYYTWPKSSRCDTEKDIVRNEIKFVSVPEGVARY